MFRSQILNLKADLNVDLKHSSVNELACFFINPRKHFLNVSRENPINISYENQILFIYTIFFEAYLYSNYLQKKKRFE